MFHATIDLDDASATITPHHDLAARLAQLEQIAQRGAFADDHVVNVLLDRYSRMRERREARQLSA
jgi:hypothetical protein